MKKILLLILFIVFMFSGFAQNLKGYNVEALLKLEAKKAFVIDLDTFYATTQLSGIDTILATKDYIKYFTDSAMLKVKFPINDGQTLIWQADSGFFQGANMSETDLIFIQHYLDSAMLKIKTPIQDGQMIVWSSDSNFFYPVDAAMGGADTTYIKNYFNDNILKIKIPINDGQTIVWDADSAFFNPVDMVKIKFPINDKQIISWNSDSTFFEPTDLVKVKLPFVDGQLPIWDGDSGFFKAGDFPASMIQTLSTTGGAGNVSITSGNTITLNVNDADASVTNEGSLTVGAGTSTTALIQSNSSGSTPVTISVDGVNLGITESGNTITLQNLKPVVEGVYEPVISPKNTGFNKPFGTTTGTVLQGRTFGSAANNNTSDFESPLTFSTGLSRTGNVVSNTITQYTDALARGAISLTTSGTSGAATYNNSTGVLNIPNYAVGTGGTSLSGNGYVFMTGTTPSYDNTVFNSSNANLNTVNWTVKDATTQYHAINKGQLDAIAYIPTIVSGTLILGGGGNSLQTGANYNTFVGVNSGVSNTTGSYNTANGYSSLRTNTTGNSNTANGMYSLYLNTTGNSNTANGYSSLYANTTGGYNTANGYSSLYANTTGGYNTANGTYSLYANTTGSRNTANGYQAGFYTSSGTSNETGANSVFLGYDTRANANGETNQIVIGYNAIGKGSNTATIGNDAIVTTYLKGRVLIGATDNATDKLQVNGSILGTTAKLTNLTDNFYPFHKSDALGLVDGNVKDVSGVMQYSTAKTFTNARDIVDKDYVDNAITGGNTYLGTWNASSNTPTLSDATGSVGDMYAVSVTGTRSLGSGSITWTQGGFAIHNGTKYEFVGTGAAVSSVNSYTGVVNLYPQLTGNKINILGNATDIDISTSTAVAANTAKVTNATHIGDVYGDTLLTLATVNSDVGTFNNVTVNGKGLVTGASNISYLTATDISNKQDKFTNGTGRLKNNGSGVWTYDNATYLTSYTETDPIYSGSSWFSTTNNSTNWNTAYSERNRWDGSATGLVAATGRTSLGGTTIGQALFTSPNPSAIRFARANADNTVSWLNANDFLVAIGAGTSTGTVSSVSMTVPTGLQVSGAPITTTGTLALTLQSGYSIPTTTKQGQWDASYSWGNHAGLYKAIGYVPTWSEITSKPLFSTVATTGSYNSLLDKPTIPDAQVNSNWLSVSGISQILNKPTKLSDFTNDLTTLGDITAVYAGDGMTGGGLSGDVYLNLNLGTLANNTGATTTDYIPWIAGNGDKKMQISQLATLLGTSQWNNDASGISYSSGNVGIGIAANPSTGLYINKNISSGVGLFVYNSSSSGGGIETNVNSSSSAVNSLYARSNAGTGLKVRGDGKVFMPSISNSSQSNVIGINTSTGELTYFPTPSGGGGGGTVTSVIAGNGMTQTGTSTINPTLNIVSHAGVAGSIGTINVTADAIGVNLGTSSTTAYRGDLGNTAYGDRLKWDGNATGLNAVNGRVSLGFGATPGGVLDGTWASPGLRSKVVTYENLDYYGSLIYNGVLSYSPTDHSLIWNYTNGSGNVLREVNTIMTGTTEIEKMEIGTPQRNQKIISESVFTLANKTTITYKELFQIPAQSGSIIDNLIISGLMGNYADGTGKGYFTLTINNRKTTGTEIIGTYTGSALASGAANQVSDIVVYKNSMTNKLHVYAKTRGYTLPWAIDATGTFEVGTSAGAAYPVYTNRASSETTVTPTGTEIYSFQKQTQTVQSLTVVSGAVTIDASIMGLDALIPTTTNVTITLKNLIPKQTGNITIRNTSTAKTISFVGYTVKISPALSSSGGAIPIPNGTSVMSYFYDGTNLFINGTTGYL